MTIAKYPIVLRKLCYSLSHHEKRIKGYGYA